MELYAEEIGDGITCIETHYIRPGLACCYLVREGESAALIDTGTTHTVPMILELLERKGIGRESVRYVIPTHVHLDHAGGSGALMQALPAAQLVVHPQGARHLVDPAKLKAGATAVYGEEAFARDFGELVPVAASRVVEAPDGFTLELDGRVLRFLDTPGHARHHFCVWDERSRGFFTGDTFGMAYRELATEKGPFMLLPSTPVQFEPERWRETLSRLMSYDPRRMYLTHYCAVDNPEALVGALEEQLDAFSEIARGADPKARFESIGRGLYALFVERLRRHGCTLDDAEIDRLLADDVDLFAKGLVVWMERQAPA